LTAAYRPSGNPAVVIFDVGQGDAILVEGGRGGRLLVDGGPDPGRLLRLLDARLAPWDRRLDIVLVSHPHDDHVAGLPTLLARYRVGSIVTNGMTGTGPAAATLARLLTGDRRVTTAAAGDRLVVDGLELGVLWPVAGTVPPTAPDSGSEVNDTSIVLLGTTLGHHFLLTGDVEEGVDPQLVARGLPRLALLKVPHHGSRTATTVGLLEVTRPTVAVVSVGAGNPYGHPAPETLDRLRAVGAVVLRTDLVGTVEVVFRTGRIEVHSAAGAELFGADDPASGANAPISGPTSAPAADVRRAGAPPSTARVTPPTGGGPPLPGLGIGIGYDRPDDVPRLGRPADRPSSPEDAPAGDAGRGFGTAALERARRRGSAPRSTTPAADAIARRRHRAPPHGRRRLRTAAGRRAPPRIAPAGERTVIAPREADAAPGADAAASGDLVAGTGRSTAVRTPGRVPTTAIGFFGGDDEYAVEEAVSAFARRVAGSGPPLERWRISGNERTLEEVTARLGSAALFGGGTIAVVRDADRLVADRSAARRSERIGRLLDSVAAGNALAIVDLRAPGKKPSATLAALKAGVAARGGVVEEHRAPTEGAMTSWILERARERGIRLEPAAAAELAARVGAFVREGDVDRRGMARLASIELDKLGHYRGSAPVRAEDVRALVPEAIPTSTWAALDAVAERRVRGSAHRPGALALLDRLVEETPPPLLIAQLHRRLRDLIAVKGILAGGATPEALVRELKLNPFRARLLAEQAARWSFAELEAALDGLLELDLRFKNVPPATERQQRLAVALWLLDVVAPREELPLSARHTGRLPSGERGATTRHGTAR
jgi:DNA polymerase III delta subunit